MVTELPYPRSPLNPASFFSGILHPDGIGMPSQLSLLLEEFHLVGGVLVQQLRQWVS
jgi:hypothetical protein